MARSGGKLIFLTGAPLSRSLRWEDEFLSASLQHPFLDSAKSLHDVPASTTTGPIWRCLSMENNGIHAGLKSPISVNHPDDESDCDRESALFLNTSHLSQVSAGSSFTDPSQSAHSSHFSGEEEEEISQFYEESYAVHEEVSSSDVMGHGSSNDTRYDESFDDTLNSVDPDHPPWDAKANMVKIRLMASLPRNLNNLPTAAYLQSITPQTVTINVVVGIISILPPREITTRRGGRRKVHLVEMLVGDDTRAGFAINIWLDNFPNIARSATTTTAAVTTNAAGDQSLATIVTNLRPRDIILIRNAALNSFQGRVYGQSLRPKGMTTIDLLYRHVIDSTDTCGAYSAQELREIPSSPSLSSRGESSPTTKLKRVKQWVMDFVGTTTHVSLDRRSNLHGSGDDGDGDGDETRKKQRKELYLVSLPTDTQ